MPTKKKSTGDNPDNPELTGYSGSPEEGQPPPKRPESASEDAVVSDVGVTEPTKVYKGDGLTAYSAEPRVGEDNEDQTFTGNYKLTGKTFHGKTITNAVNVPSAVTKEGLFNIFKAHNPDAIEEGFAYEEIKPPPPPPENGG